MAFSKLIYADRLAAVQKISKLYKSSSNYSTFENVLTGYEDDAKKAIIFTGDEFIVNHAHQYYTGVPMLNAGFTFVNTSDSSKTDDFKVLDGNNIHKGEILPTAIWSGDLLTSLTTLSAGTKYGVQVDEKGHAFVAVTGDSANPLTVNHNPTGLTLLDDDTTNLVYNPSNSDSTLSVIDGINQFTLVNKYTAKKNVNGSWVTDESKGVGGDVTEQLTVHITPQIAQNVIAKNSISTKTEGEGDSATTTNYSGLASHIVWFETDQEDGNAIQIADSGLQLTKAEDFTQTSGIYTPSASVVPTEKAVAAYIANSLGSITGALRFKGNADGSVTTETTTKNSNGETITDAWVSSGTFNTYPQVSFAGYTDGTGEFQRSIKIDDTTYNLGDTLPKGYASDGTARATMTDATPNSDMDYKQGDVYYVNAAGWYAGQYCEKGDMLVAIKDKSSSYNSGDWTVVQNNWNAIDGSASVKWGTTTTLATIGGVDIDITMPTSPESSVKVLYGVGDVTSTETTGTSDDMNDYFGISRSINTNTTLSIGTLTKTTDSSNVDHYTPGLEEVGVKGIDGLAVYATPQITHSATDADVTAGKATKIGDTIIDSINTLFVRHTNYLTNTDIAANTTTGADAVAKNLFTETDTLPEGTSLNFYKVAFDANGHVSSAQQVSNTLNFYTGAKATVSGANIVDYDDTASGSISDAVSFVGNTTDLVFEGIENGDIKIETEFTTSADGKKNILRILPTLTSNYRAIKVDNTEILGNYAYSALNLVAGSNVILTPELVSGAYTGKVTIDAVDTWRSIKYYNTTSTNYTSETPVLSNPTDKTDDGTTVAADTINYNYGAAGDNTATQINIASKNLGTNALIFGEEFTISEDEAPEVHIEWCEITSTESGGTVTVSSVEFTY